MEKIYLMLESIHPEYNYRESENFIDQGLLDSFDVITLIDMIESEYGIEIDGMDIIPENFFNVERIMRLIEKGQA